MSETVQRKQAVSLELLSKQKSDRIRAIITDQFKLKSDRIRAIITDQFKLVWQNPGHCNWPA